MRLGFPACAAGMACAAWLVAAGAAAQEAEPLTSNDYTIDLVQTPVLGSGRIVGLGGAYTALADGIDGAPWNPAAYGSRTLWELDWFEWELTGTLLFPGAFSDDDFYNSGVGRDFESLVFLAFGFRLQLGDVGFGVLPRIQQFQLEDVDVSFVVGSYGMAWQLLDGQIVVGVGARSAQLTITDPAGLELVRFNGTGPEVGVLLKLSDQPWRLGAAARTAVSSPCESVGEPCAEAGGFVLPRAVHMPWELQVGFAVQIGRRPLNRRWVDPEIAERAIEGDVTMRQWRREREQVWRETGGGVAPASDPYQWLPGRATDPGFWRREEALRAEEGAEIEERIEAAEDARDREVEELPRAYVLLTADVLVSGRTDHGVGIEGFLAQRRLRSGDEVTYSVRLGLETEPWQGRLKLRAGTYVEPSRYPGGGYRVHGTGGFDLRLFRWDLFGLFDDFDVRVGLTGDVAARYFDWGLGIGFWH